VESDAFMLRNVLDTAIARRARSNFHTGSTVKQGQWPVCLLHSTIQIQGQNDPAPHWRTIIHWMPIMMTQLWMNLNWVSIRFRV
jgi:hypothetical protein